MSRHVSPLRAAFVAAWMAFACHAAADSSAPPALKVTQGIGSPAAVSHRLTAEEQAILCLDLKSLTTLKEETATLNDMAARLQRMQATANEVRTLIEAMPADRPGVAALPVVPSPVAVASTPPPTALPDLPWTQIAAGGGLLALLGLLWLRRRQAAAAPLPNIKSVATTIDEPLPSAPMPARKTGHSPGIPRALRAAAVALEAKPESAPAADAGSSGAAVEPQEADQALELAEVMVSMGLTQAAADTLVEHIRAHPRRTLYHWLKLLDIYKTSGQKEDFEQSATELRRNFNIQMDDWQAAKGAPLRSIEDYGHICARVQELWGKAGGVDYMARLLEDNRGGARLGFPQSVAEEILLLIAILRDGGHMAGR